MPDDEPTTDHDDGPALTRFGVASAVLAVIAVAAVALAALIWVQHDDHTDELRYRAAIMAAAAEWTEVLINMNRDTVDADMNALHEGTVGQLNADFEASVEPYRKLVQTLQSRTRGQIDSVAVETIHHEQPGADGARPPQPELAEAASRTDTVMVIATSVSENAGDEEPRTVRWNLRLDVSEVDGRLLISGLEPIR
ncbi:hypothetical protein [Mycobacterium sp. IDR2000157661]|uniref:hypothetical protein n=1 Tax=Mycobacterium sp. IDR2000157661 TaxID=2867005 RepID=UPI001EEC7E2F|nr:hypothetical protein [Mycobacterium sp. IDR2000157661]ULE34593.1 hypothetical protein K3G64_08300 [Mycobacterium sp. IDR2000157661]